MRRNWHLGHPHKEMLVTSDFRDWEMALKWGARRPRRYLLFNLMLDTLIFYPEAQLRSRTLRAHLPASYDRGNRTLESCFRSLAKNMGGPRG